MYAALLSWHTLFNFRGMTSSQLKLGMLRTDSRSGATQRSGLVVSMVNLFPLKLGIHQKRDPLTPQLRLCLLNDGLNQRYTSA